MNSLYVVYVYILADICR